MSNKSQRYGYNYVQLGHYDQDVGNPLLSLSGYHLVPSYSTFASTNSCTPFQTTPNNNNECYPQTTAPNVFQSYPNVRAAPNTFQQGINNCATMSQQQGNVSTIPYFSINKAYGC